MISAKVCVVGDFAVGKTSAVERYVNNHFDAKYLTTVGVKIDTLEVQGKTGAIKLVIWDVAGQKRFSELEFSYLRGAQGFILVVDGTRLTTFDVARELVESIRSRHPQQPIVGLLNKGDLKQSWELPENASEQLEGLGVEAFETSAKEGYGVNDAFAALARAL